MAERKSKKEPTFEEGLAQLEKIASQMEKNELPLDQLLKLYEQGMALSKMLSEKLTTAQNQLQILSLNSDNNMLEVSEAPQNGGYEDEL